jgi:cellobiose transport system permease protein
MRGRRPWTTSRTRSGRPGRARDGSPPEAGPAFDTGHPRPTVSDELKASTTPELPASLLSRPTRRRARRAWTSKLDLALSPYAYVAPFFVIFFAFGLFPVLYTGWVSLHDVSLQNTDEMAWVGLDNYSRLLHSDRFWNALLNTFTIGVISTVPQLLMAIGLAHVLNSKLRGSTFFRVSMLIPYATSVAAATIVFAMLFGRDFGLINWFLGLFGVDNIDWQSGRWSSQIAISVIVTWRWTGYNALIYLAAMQSIPKDLYEAAEVDGANRWQQLRHVTVPGIKPTIVFTVIVSTIGATQLFGEPLLFGGAGGYRGGADHQYQTLGLLLYEQGWFNFQLGRAAATAWTMFLIIMVAVVLNALLASRGRSVLGVGRRRRST